VTRRYFLVVMGSTARPVRRGEPVAKYERVLRSDFPRPRTPQADGSVYEVPYEYALAHAEAIREGVE